MSEFAGLGSKLLQNSHDLFAMHNGQAGLLGRHSGLVIEPSKQTQSFSAYCNNSAAMWTQLPAVVVVLDAWDCTNTVVSITAVDCGRVEERGHVRKKQRGGTLCLANINSKLTTIPDVEQPRLVAKVK